MEAPEEPGRVVHACEPSLGGSRVKRKSQPEPQKQVQGHAFPLLCSAMAQELEPLECQATAYNGVTPSAQK